MKLDAQLDSEHFYSQVPALAAGDRGVFDLLGITRKGRLVVIELKASEDIQLPVQAVDYWLRVRRHQREGDFQRIRLFCRSANRSAAAVGMVGGAGSAFPFRHRHSSEIFIARNSSHADRTFRKLAPRIEDRFSPAINRFWNRLEKGREAAWVEPEPLPGVCPRSN